MNKKYFYSIAFLLFIPSIWAFRYYFPISGVNFYIYNLIAVIIYSIIFQSVVLKSKVVDLFFKMIVIFILYHIYWFVEYKYHYLSNDVYLIKPISEKKILYNDFTNYYSYINYSKDIFKKMNILLLLIWTTIPMIVHYLIKFFTRNYSKNTEDDLLI